MFKKISSLFFSFAILAISWPTQKTEAFSWPSPNKVFTKTSPVEAMNAVLWDLGVDKDELRYGVRSMNVSRRKKQPPSVALSFRPKNPSSGEKITAIATPQYFLNSAENLYFTWFLKPGFCTDNRDKDYRYNSRCDLNDDGRVNIEDHKIRAMRIIANNDFEWDRRDESGRNPYQSSTKGDGDGYQSFFGGHDQQGKSSHCFVNDTYSGNEYEITCKHLFPHAPGKTTGDGSFGTEEEEFWRTNPEDPDTADTGNGDEANVAGLGINTFSWIYESGDKVGVVAEGISVEPTQYNDSSYRVMWGLPKTCFTNDLDPGEDPNDPTNSETTEVEETIDPETGLTVRTTTTTTRTLINEGFYAGKIRVRIVTLIEYVDPITEEVIAQLDPETTTYYLTPYSTNSYLPGQATPGLTTGSRIDFDMNDCLYQNLIDPMDGGGKAEKMEVELSYLPKFPINDPSEESSDELIVTSTVTNAKDRNYLSYSWSVFASDQANSDSWGEPIPKEYLKGVSQLSGIGLGTLKFKLAFGEDFFGYLKKRKVEPTDGKIYLKIKLNVEENVSSGNYRSGHSSVIVPISLSQNRIRVFNISASSSESPVLSLKETKEDERCVLFTEKGEKIFQPVCPVAKNEIVGLKVDQKNLSDYEFSWTLNGKPLEPLHPGSGREKPGNIVYFAVLENPGSNYNITLTMTDLKKEGKKTSLSKIFEVIEPSAKIIPLDESVTMPNLAGRYVDLNGKEWLDYSQEKFLSLTGYTLRFKPLFTAFYPEKHSWSVNGLAVSANASSMGYAVDSDGILAIPESVQDSYYKISVKALYTQKPEIKKALNKYWGVAYNEFYEKNVSHQIETRLVNFFPENPEIGKGKDLKESKPLANLWLSTPAYFLFLFRISITVMLLLFGSQLLFLLFPQNKKIKKNEI